MQKEGKIIYLHSKSTPRSTEQGVAMLEMCIAMIILVPILTGIIQWGLIIAASMTVHNDAAVAARQIVLVTTPSDPNIKTTVAQIVVDDLVTTSPTLDLANIGPISVQQESIGAGTNNAWSVTVSYDLPLIFSLVVPSSNNGVLRLTAKTVMQ